MKNIPTILGGAKVVLYTPIDGRHRPTGNCKQIMAACSLGRQLVWQSVNMTAKIPFISCDQEWNSVTDTWHQTVEDAKAQAEFEYEGVSATWSEPDA